MSRPKWESLPCKPEIPHSLESGNDREGNGGSEEAITVIWSPVQMDHKRATRCGNSERSPSSSSGPAARRSRGSRARLTQTARNPKWAAPAMSHPFELTKQMRAGRAPRRSTANAVALARVVERLRRQLPEIDMGEAG